METLTQVHGKMIKPGFGIKNFHRGDRHEGYYVRDKRNGLGHILGLMVTVMKANGSVVRCPAWHQTNGIWGCLR